MKKASDNQKNGFGFHRRNDIFDALLLEDERGRGCLKLLLVPPTTIKVPESLNMILPASNFIFTSLGIASTYVRFLNLSKYYNHL